MSFFFFFFSEAIQCSIFCLGFNSSDPKLTIIIGGVFSFVLTTMMVDRGQNELSIEKNCIESK